MTAALTDDVLVGCTAGGCAQGAATPLFMACQNSHVEVVKLLLADSDVLVNQATMVRRSGWLRERGQGGRLTSQLSGLVWKKIISCTLHVRSSPYVALLTVYGMWCTAAWEYTAVHRPRQGPHGDSEDAAGSTPGKLVRIRCEARLPWRVCLRACFAAS